VRILLVEDTIDVGEAIVACFERMGHGVDWETDGTTAFELVEVQSYDLIILDVTLPGRDGFDILQRLRALRRDTPVLVVTARSQVDDRVGALDLGADDYLVKPFDFRELEARARALLRRRHGQSVNILACGDIVLDQATRSVKVADRPVDLTRREIAVLEVLMAQPQRVLAKEAILDQVFGFDESVHANAVELYIARLRRKLTGARAEIRTLRGLGYRILARD